MTPDAKPKSGRTFEHQRHLDRLTVKHMLDNIVQGHKLRQMTRADRVEYVKGSIRAKWAEREKTGKTTTARREYPKQFDEEAEMEYYLNYVSTHIGVPSEEEQQDDPEDRYFLLGLRGIKKEVTYEESPTPTSDSESEDHSVDAASDEQSEDEEGEPDEEPACVVVSRGFVIQNSKPGLGSLALRVSASREAKSKTSSLVGRIDPRGIVKQQSKKSAKRTWKWLNGKLVVWPPFESVVHDSEVAQEEEMK